ncbi:hypothetical protein Cabys_1954 [Caldithrix abyssi DSM 13497]|uniref:Uncharacterized protein n=1 Tax=Caldithrix abyssi DSM 13497 TaxID=880073 RepID=A0A1J1C7T2_CALAY|nr:hypothetical protein Cabys_1954 [Caldithrix abyssi DSM 13497]
MNQGSTAATKTNRNARKVIFSQITPIIAEKEKTNYFERKIKQIGAIYAGAVPKVKDNVFL